MSTTKPAEENAATNNQTPDDVAGNDQPLRLGTALWELGREMGLTDAEIAAIDRTRERNPAEPIAFD